MKIVNFAKVIYNLKGDALKDPDTNEVAMLSKIIGNILAQHKATDAIRQFAVAEKIYNSEGDIDLEDADFKMVETVAKETNLSCMTAKVLQECLKTAKDKQG